MKKNTVEISLIMLLVLMMYFQNDFINKFSKSVLGKSISIVALWYVYHNFGRNAGILAALIMISNLYNAYNPFVDTVEGFFEGLPRGGRQPKPEKPKPKPENPEEKKVAKGLTAGRAWLSEASAASLMRQIKKRKRGRGQGGKDDDTQLTAVGAPPAMGTAQGGGGGPGDTFANRLSYSELDGALQMSAAENTHNASR